MLYKIPPIIKKIIPFNVQTASNGLIHSKIPQPIIKLQATENLLYLSTSLILQIIAMIVISQTTVKIDHPNIPFNRQRQIGV